MQRKGIVMAAVMWGSCAGVGPRGAVQIELLEGDVAQVVDLDSGRAAAVRRERLPREAREGDVVVDGRVDPTLTRELLRQVRELHERLAVPVPRGLDLGGDEGPGTPGPLTADPE